MAPSYRQGEEGRGDGIQVLTIVPVEKTGACKNVLLRGWHCCDARQKRPGDDDISWKSWRPARLTRSFVDEVSRCPSPIEPLMRPPVRV